MRYLTSYKSLLLLSSLFSYSVNALEFRVIDSNVSIAIPNTATPYEIIETITAPSFARGHIGFADNVGSLYIQLAAKKRSKVRIEHDNAETVFPLGNFSEVAFNAPGSIRTIRFNVFKPVSGSVKIYNQNNKLLKTIPYSVTKERSYRQRISTGVNENRDSDGDANKNVSVSYSISQRTKHNADPYWSFSTSLSSDMDELDDRSINAGFSYSW